MSLVEAEPLLDARHSESSRVASLLDVMLPSSLSIALRRETIEERSRARIVVAFLLILCGVSASVVAIQTFAGSPVGAAMGVVFGLTFLALLIAVRTGVPIRYMTHVMIGCIYTFSVSIMVTSAGLAITAVLISSLIPLIASLIVGPRHTLGWTFATLGGVAATVWYASSTQEYLYSGQVLSWDTARFPIITATVVFVYAVTVVIDRARALADSEARVAREQLDQQNARYRSIVENQGDVLMDFDEDAYCRYVSSNCESILGRQEKELLGFEYNSLIHPDDAEALSDLYKFSRMHPGATRALALRISHSDGSWLHAQLSSRCYFNEHGALHFTIIARDTTNVRLAEMTTRHHERLKSAGTLSAGIAHQINNPVGSILTASQYGLISLREQDWASVEKALNDNIAQATRCGQIVRSLLHFAARESPKTGREDLLGIIRRSREFTLSYAGENAIAIELSGDLESIWVDVSSIEIEQVLINLLRNAIESQPASNRVEVMVTRLKDRARVEVKDDGRGFGPDARAQIFDPFYTTRIHDGGSGLGLSVAHGIIRDHGGSIEIESRVDEGTTATFELPLALD